MVAAELPLTVSVLKLSDMNRRCWLSWVRSTIFGVWIVDVCALHSVGRVLSSLSAFQRCWRSVSNQLLFFNCLLGICLGKPDSCCATIAVIQNTGTEVRLHH